MASKQPGGSRLSAVRRRIDRLDEQLLRLINQRASLALVVGRIKRRRKWPVFDAKREAFVLYHIERSNRGPLSARAVRHVFQAILCECRRWERSGKSKGRPQSIVHGPR
jgi:chorismate mutase